MSLRLTISQYAALRSGKKPRSGSGRGERWADALALQLDHAGIAYTREYRFCPPRRFRFDFALNLYRIAVEVDGAVHRIANRFAEDREKMNLAMLARWRVVHVTPREVRTGEALDLIRRVIAS